MRSDRRSAPSRWIPTLVMLGACTSTPHEAEPDRAARPDPGTAPAPAPTDAPTPPRQAEPTHPAERAAALAPATEPPPAPAPSPPVEFAPTDPPAPPTGSATTLRFDADPPSMWFDNPDCHSRYARAATLHVRLPKSVDIDVARIHALRGYSTHTLVWTPAAARHLAKAPRPRTRSRARWRLVPDTPVQLWVIDASPSPAHAESCWDVVKVQGTVEFETADGSLGITEHAQILQLTPTSTRLRMHAPIEAFGLAYTPDTLALDPSLELHLDLPVLAPRNTIPERLDNRGLTPIEAQLRVTVDQISKVEGRRLQMRGIEHLAVSEESPEAREVLGVGPR